eukprot:Awhi_evm1s14193
MNVLLPNIQQKLFFNDCVAEENFLHEINVDTIADSDNDDDDENDNNSGSRSDDME